MYSINKFSASLRVSLFSFIVSIGETCKNTCLSNLIYKEIGQLLKSVPSDHKVAQALNYYSSHTAQIEVVRQDKSLEQVRDLLHN